MHKPEFNGYLWSFLGFAAGGIVLLCARDGRFERIGWFADVIARARFDHRPMRVEAQFSTAKADGERGVTLHGRSAVEQRSVRQCLRTVNRDTNKGTWSKTKSNGFLLP